MDLVGKALAVWLSDEAARLFLGLPRQKTASQWTRWCALGIVTGETEGVGLWMDVQVVQERKGRDSKIVQSWHVKPELCLIRWDFVIHAQVWGELMPEPSQPMGFLAA